MIVKHISIVNTVADLKVRTPSANTICLLVGKTTMGDGLGGHYWWDSTATDAEDTVYLNVVPCTGITTGRWRRIIVRTLVLPHGTLVINGGIKSFYYSGVIDANSSCVVNLTYENTTTGTPIFTNVWYDNSVANINATVPYDAVSSYRKTLSSDNKVLTHGYYRGTSTTLGNSLTALIGLVIPSFRYAVAGTPVNFKVEGN